MTHEQKTKRVVSPLQQKNGFTLVELLGAVAIIAVLAVIACVSIMDAVRASQVQAIHKQEFELNLAWQNQRSLGAPDTSDLETAITLMMTQQEINGHEMAKTMVAPPPRTMWVGGEEKELTFIGKEFHYYPQSLVVTGPSTPTPTPEPTPEATPAEMVTITVNPLPEWSAPGSTSKTGIFSVAKGSIFTIQAIPGSASVFVEWMLGTYDGWENWDGLASPNLSFTVEGDQQLTAYFQPGTPAQTTPTPTPSPTATPIPTVAITVKAPKDEYNTAHPEAGYTSLTQGVYDMPVGQTFAITASANFGWQFFVWQETGDTNPFLSFTATTPRTLTPLFRAAPLVQLFIGVQTSAENNGFYGEVTVSPALQGISGDSRNWQGQLTQGSTVTLHAQPAPGYKFVGWRGAVYMDTIDQNLSYTATFSSQQIIAQFEPL